MLKLILITLLLIAHYADAAEAPEEDAVVPNDESDVERQARVAPFVVSTAEANWYDASMICRKQGLHLVKFADSTEWTTLQGTLSTSPYILTQSVWTAGTNLANRRVWSWFSTGLPLAYNNWANGQPNNFTGNQYCLALNVATGQWNDVQCSAQKFFICETLPQ